MTVSSVSNRIAVLDCYYSNQLFDPSSTDHDSAAVGFASIGQPLAEKYICNAFEFRKHTLPWFRMRHTLPSFESFVAFITIFEEGYHRIVIGDNIIMPWPRTSIGTTIDVNDGIDNNLYKVDINLAKGMYLLSSRTRSVIHMSSCGSQSWVTSYASQCASTISIL